MRYHLLKHIKGEGHDRLAWLFNRYMDGLTGWEGAVVHRESMHEFSDLLAQDAAAGTRQAAKRALPLYRLRVLVLALTRLHKCIHGAGLILSEFFEVYQGDFTAYATEERLNTIDAFGPDEDEDSNEDGTPNLAPYTLRATLAEHFAGPGTEGEAIGTSGPADFAYFSSVASAPSDVRLRHLFDGTPVQTFRQTADEIMVPETLGDQLESELNEDLAKEAVVLQFNAVLELGQKAAALYAGLGHEDTAGYRQLFDLLTQLQNGAFKTQ